MPKIIQHPVPVFVKPYFWAAGIKIKKYATVAAFEKDLAEHVAKANAYGRSWGDRMDKIGIVAVLKETRMTIKWFKNLTVEELRRSFKE